MNKDLINRMTLLDKIQSYVNTFEDTNIEEMSTTRFLMSVIDIIGTMEGE